MSIEIERKFLVNTNIWNPITRGEYYCQGYLNDTNNIITRVRIAKKQGFITIKSKSIGISRHEYEYSIPLNDAMNILKNIIIKPLIEKIRYTIDYKGYIWEVDEFLGDNKGLIIAEIELKNENQNFYKPDWIGAEVSHDSRYYNYNLANNPYSNWK